MLPQLLRQPRMQVTKYYNHPSIAHLYILININKRVPINVAKAAIQGANAIQAVQATAAANAASGK